MKGRNKMRRSHGYALVFALIFGLSLGALPLGVNDAEAQTLDISGEDCGVLGILCTISESESGDGGNANGGNGGRGGNGGFASAHDIANAIASAHNSVTVGDITTGNAFGHDINVDATGADDPVVLALAGSFSDTGVDIFAPGGSSQAGTTGGNGVGADASGGDGGDGGNARGGRSGDSESCAAGLLGCIDDLSVLLGL
jgi:hypothetical protein